MSSNTSPIDAKVSAAADQLASLEVAEESSDTSTDGAAPPMEGGRVLDPELWKPHPPTEECPVCFMPLPLSENKSTYWVCCGKLICNGCTAETARATRVINAKRAKKKQPPLDHTCSFCRLVPRPSKSQYEVRIRNGDGKAAFNLAGQYRNGDADNDIPKDEAKSLELLHHAADNLGYSAAMSKLGSKFVFGLDGAPIDIVKGRKYSEDAVKVGNVDARFTLGSIEFKEENIGLAIRHWKLAAAAGCEPSVRLLWKFFFRGELEKAELEETLRAHKECCDVMSSEERERCKLLEKADEAGDDIAPVSYTHLRAHET